MKYTFKRSRYSSHGKILALLGRGNGDVCVDAGCASGYLAKELSQRGWHVVGIEPDPIDARLAADYCREVVESDLDSVDFALIQPFKSIVFGDVLEHLQNPERTLSRSIEHLDPNGVVVISVPNIANLMIRISLLIGRFDYTERGILDRTHLRFFTRRSLRELVEKCDLKIEIMTQTPIPVEEVLPDFRGLRWIPPVANAVTRVFPTLLGYQFVVRARRVSPR